MVLAAECLEAAVSAEELAVASEVADWAEVWQACLLDPVVAYLLEAASALAYLGLGKLAPLAAQEAAAAGFLVVRFPFELSRLAVLTKNTF